MLRKSWLAASNWGAQGTSLLLAVTFFAAVAALGADSTGSNAPASTKPAPPGGDLFANDVVAKGKGFEIKRAQLDDAVISLKSTALARGQTIPPDQAAMLDQQVLDRLIQIQILLGKATEDDKTKGQELFKKRFDMVRTRAGSDEVLNRQLKSVGMNQDDLKAKMIEEATAESVLDRELQIAISDDAVKKYYDDNPARFEQPEMVRASHILLMTSDPATHADLSDDKKAAKRKLAEELVKRARAGDDFAKLAKEYSEDPGSKDKGGEYTFPRGQMVAEFEAVAFALKTNEVSDVVTTQFGYHVIKSSEKIPAKKVELSKVSPDIKEYLKQQATQKQLPAYMDKLKKDAGVEILDEKLKLTAKLTN